MSLVTNAAMRTDVRLQSSTRQLRHGTARSGGICVDLRDDPRCPHGALRAHFSDKNVRRPTHEPPTSGPAGSRSRLSGTSCGSDRTAIACGARGRGDRLTVLTDGIPDVLEPASCQSRLQQVQILFDFRCRRPTARPESRRLPMFRCDWRPRRSLLPRRRGCGFRPTP